MENNSLNQHNNDCGCSGTVSGYHRRSTADNSQRLNETGTTIRSESLSGPDGYAIRIYSPSGAASNLLKGPDSVVSQQQNGTLRLPVLNFTDWPRVENGLLAFRDHEHFDAYSIFIEDTVNAPNRGAVVTMDDFFNNVESQIGFTSLRRVTDEAFDRLSEKGWSDSEEIPDRHFIPDILLKSLLNPNGEVKIGNKITRIVNKSVAVTVSASNQPLITLMRQLPYNTKRSYVKLLQAKYPLDFYVDDWSIQEAELDRGNVITGTASEFDGNNVTRIFTLDPSGDTLEPYVPIVLAPTDEVTSSGIFVIGAPMDSGNAGGGTSPVSRPYTIGASFDVKVVDQCSGIQTRVKTEGLYLVEGSIIGGTSTLVRSKFEINWGDGSSPTTVYSESSGYVPDQTHDYPTPGLKEIRVRGWKVNPSGTIMGPETGPISKFANIGCFVGQSRDSNWREVKIDGWRKVKGKHWVEQWRTFGGTGERRARTGAITEAYHWNNFAGVWKWRKYGAAHGTDAAYAIRKYSDSDCSTSFLQEDHNENGGWECLVFLTQYGSHFGWFEMKSKHVLHTNDLTVPLVVLEFSTNVCDL